MFVQFFLRYTSLVFINWSSPIQVLFSWAISSPIVAILNCFVLPWLGHYIQQHAYMITQAIECTSQNKHALRLKLYSIGWVLIDCTVWCKVHSFAWSDSRSSAFSQQHLCITGVYMLETFSQICSILDKVWLISKLLLLQNHEGIELGVRVYIWLHISQKLHEKGDVLEATENYPEISTKHCINTTICTTCRFQKSFYTMQ